MKLTNVGLYSNGTEIANFSFKDPGSINPYLARTISGLDVSEVVPKFYGYSTSGAPKNQYNMAQGERVITIRIQLNPQFTTGKSYSELRDDLYRAIGSTRYGVVQLRFNNGETTIAAIEGFITKLEAPVFNKIPEVQVTIRCEDPTIKAIDPVDIDTSSFTSTFEIIDDVSTMAHGFQFSLVLEEDVAEIVIANYPVSPQWTFTINPYVIDGETGFLAGDEIYFSSEHRDRKLFMLRDGSVIHLGDKILAGSSWPMIFPGGNDFFMTIGDFYWTSFTHYLTYWGV